MLRTIVTATLFCASLAAGGWHTAVAQVPDEQLSALAQLDSGLVGQLIPSPSAPTASTLGTLAQACLDANQIRAAVAANQVRPLSAFVARLKQVAPNAQVLPGPQLCQTGGGGFMYIVNLLGGNGQVHSVTIDAVNGTILRR